MTEEQEEAIESLEQLINIRKNKAGQIKYDNCICSTTDLETVLNILKEKDVEIEKKDKIIDLRNKELRIKEDELKLSDEERIKLYKMIDLMAEYISNLDIDEDICKEQSDNNCDDINREVECKDCIKHFFKRKAKDGRL